MAAQEGHLDTVRLLVKAGAAKDQARVRDGATPLIMAAQGGHLDIVRFLVEAGTAKDQAACDGTAPLMVAVEERHLETIRLLMESRAESDASGNLASQLGCVEVVRLVQGLGSKLPKVRRTSD